MNFALRVAILRTVRTQQQLAVLSGIRPEKLSRIVNGWIRPSSEERKRIALALGQPEACLFDEDVPRTGQPSRGVEARA